MSEENEPKNTEPKQDPPKPDDHNMSIKELLEREYGGAKASSLEGAGAKLSAELSKKHNLPFRITDQLAKDVGGYIESLQPKELTDSEKTTKWLKEDELNKEYLKRGLQALGKSPIAAELELQKNEMTYDQVQLLAKHGKEDYEKEPNLVTDFDDSVGRLSEEEASASIEQFAKENSRAIFNPNHKNHSEVLRRYQALSQASGGKDPFGIVDRISLA